MRKCCDHLDKHRLRAFLSKLKITNLSKVTYGILRVGFLRVLSIPIGLVLSIVLARFLGVEKFGQFSFIMALMPVLSLPITGGAPRLLIREVAKYKYLEKWGLYKGAIFSAFLGVAVFSVTVISCLYVAVSFFGLAQHDEKLSYLLVGSILLPVLGFNAIRSSIFTGLGHPSITEANQQILLPLSILILVFLHYGYYSELTVRSALLAQVAGGVLVFVFALTFIPYQRVEPGHLADIKREYELKLWLTSLIPLTLIVMANTFNAQFGILLLGLVGTDEGAAGLKVAERGAQLVILSLNVINMVIGPYLVRGFQDNDIGELQSLSHKAARGCFALALPTGLVLIVFGKTIIAIAYGDDYVNIAYTPMVILVTGQMINAGCGSVGLILTMCGHERSILAGQLIGLGATLVTCTALIPSYGAVGAAIGVTTGLVAWNAILSFFVVKKLKIRPGIF